MLIMLAIIVLVMASVAPASSQPEPVNETVNAPVVSPAEVLSPIGAIPSFLILIASAVVVMLFIGIGYAILRRK